MCIIFFKIKIIKKRRLATKTNHLETKKSHGRTLKKALEIKYKYFLQLSSGTWLGQKKSPFLSFYCFYESCLLPLRKLNRSNYSIKE